MRSFDLNTFASRANRGVIGGTDVLQDVTIQLRSSEDNIKDTTGKIGQVRSQLYLIGVVINWAGGTILDVSFLVLSNSLKTIHSKARSARTNMVQPMLQMEVDTVKAGKACSIYAKLAFIHSVQRLMAANLLSGNIQTAKVGDLWVDTTLLNSSAYLPQYDMAKVEDIC